MDQAIYSAASGAMAMEIQLTVIANNLANATTTGYKRDQITFEKYMRQLDTTSLAPLQHQRISEDVVTNQYVIDTSQGPNQQTGNALDVALNSEGYFVVNTPEGTRYTRCGAFQRSIEGQLADLQGNPVQGEGGDIDLIDGDVIIGKDGTITIEGNVIDRLLVVNIDPGKIIKVGTNYFDIEQGAETTEPENLTVLQGAIENSNVNAIKEMLGLIETQRAYDAFQKMMRTANDAYSQSIQNVGTMS